jgi:hypothetical protein
MAYSDISRGVRLAKDYANYQLWLQKDTAARQTAFKAVNNPANTVKIKREQGAVVPFTSTGALVYVPARLIAGGEQTGRGGPVSVLVRGLINEFNFDQAKLRALTSANVLEGVKFRPAKFTVIKRVNDATTKSNSRITGREYYRHENDSITESFGKKVVADTFDSVVAAIKAKAGFITVVTSKDNYRFKPESI